MKLDDTPRARIGLLIACVSFAAMLWMMFDDAGGNLKRWVRAFERVFVEWDEWAWHLSGGEKLTLLAGIFGLMLSYLHPYTLGPLLRWIRHGKAPRDP